MPNAVHADRTPHRRPAARRRALALCSVALLCLLHRPVAAATPAVTTEPITFASAGVTLSGTLVRAKQPFAAVVLVHGSGQEQRMTEFATLLATQGITALTYDKRGVGASGGVYVGPEVGTNNVDPANLSLLADDVIAATRALAERLPATRAPIGLVGFSQAGWIIPIAATREPSLRFMVVFSGPVVTTREQLRFQFMTEGKPDFWDTHRESEVRERIRTDPDRYAFVDTDPRDALAALSIPGLWLYGGRDVQLPVQLSIERLAALAARDRLFEHRLYPTLGHNTGFSDSSEPVAAAVQWIESQARTPQRAVGQRPTSSARDAGVGDGDGKGR